MTTSQSQQQIVVNIVSCVIATVVVMSLRRCSVSQPSPRRRRRSSGCASLTDGRNREPTAGELSHSTKRAYNLCLISCERWRRRVDGRIPSSSGWRGAGCNNESRPRPGAWPGRAADVHADDHRRRNYNLSSWSGDCAAEWRKMKGAGAVG